MYKIVLGIGNPGLNYAGTRHNVGFRVVDKLAEMYSLSFKKESRFKSLVAELRSDQQEFLLVKPTTYVNLSGEAGQAILSWYKLDVSSLMVIVDDLNLPLGKIRIRKKGSSGGHHGMDSIIRCLNTAEFARLRIGIGNKSDVSHISYVLSTFSRDEETVIQDSVATASEAVVLWMSEGIDAVMNKYNNLGTSDSKNE